jgi:transcription elongation factor GreA
MQFPKKRQHEIFKKFDTGPIYLTQEGLEKLSTKLVRLKASIPALAEEAGRTAAYGDRSDNAEYKDAKANLRRTSWSILSIEDQLKRVKIIDPSQNTSNTIQLGSTVTLEINGTKKTFQILGAQETNPTQGSISNESPLGTALIGHAKGEEVTIKTLRGEQKYKILEIK